MGELYRRAEEMRSNLSPDVGRAHRQSRRGVGHERPECVSQFVQRSVHDMPVQPPHSTNRAAAWSCGRESFAGDSTGLDSKTRWTRGLATGPGAQELPYLGQVRVAGAGELQQKGPVMTSARQVEYSPIPSQSVCPRHARNVTASVLPYSHKTGPKMGCNTLKPVKILRISFPQPHFFRRQSDSTRRFSVAVEGQRT